MLLPARILPAACLVLAASLPAAAASFDCSKAATPFEQAICTMPDLSAADERLAKSFAFATGGLTKGAVAQMRSDQRDWLGFAQRACTDDAEPLASGLYPQRALACLVDTFNSRSTALEQSRMIDGHRFFIRSLYGALPNPNEADNPESNWKVATHDLVMPQLDADNPLSGPFNRYVAEIALGQADIVALAASGDLDQLDPTSDASVTIMVKELAGSSRITMTVSTQWYGHGAAHGNYTTSYRHYLTQQDRGLVASDMFAGDDWANVLIQAAWEQLQAEHPADWLMVDTAADIAEMVVEPTRWDLSDPYGLVIQFQPYEVAAYAYGAPTITIAWEKLDAIKAETQEQVRYGW